MSTGGVWVVQGILSQRADAHICIYVDLYIYGMHLAIHRASIGMTAIRRADAVRLVLLGMDHGTDIRNGPGPSEQGGAKEDRARRTARRRTPPSDGTDHTGSMLDALWAEP
jgi:hypothetical protein